MQRRHVTIALAAAGLLAFTAAEARAQEVVKIGMSFSMTGAVSTNTFSSDGTRSTMKRASAFSAFFTVL